MTYHSLSIVNLHIRWNDLIITYEGSQVKRFKIDLLNSHYENFYMNENESTDEMLTRFMEITSELSSLGDKIDNDQKVRKVIQPILKSWKVKATILNKRNDKKEMDFSEFIGKTRWREKSEKKESHEKRRVLPSKQHHPST